jgi:signal transduction histidine kinase
MSIFETMLTNLDLFTVGIVVAATSILGALVYFQNPRSASNRAFLAFTLVTAAWGLANFISYRVDDATLALWSLRAVMLLATGQALTLFLFFVAFPNSSLPRTWAVRWLAVPLALVTAVATLTPLVFSHLIDFTAGTVPNAANGPLIILFGLTNVGLVATGIGVLLIKTVRAKRGTRRPFWLLLAGTAITFALIIVFNFLLPAFHEITEFIPLAALFTFPFVLMTSYAIVQYGLFRVRILSAELFVFLLIILTLFELVSEQDFAHVMIRFGVFIGLVSVGVLLIKNIFTESEQKERLEELTHELRDANEKLTQLDRVRSEFLSFASHQVKAPMSVVKGYAQLIADGTFGTVPEKVVETSGKIKESADRLISLVNNLLDLRRIEEGRMEFTFEQTDTGLLVEQTVNDVRPLAERKHLSLTFDRPDGKLPAALDLMKFRQVIQNLVENAIKYTERGGITVGTARADDDIVITVSDTGRGMAADLIPQLFEQFTREKDAKKRIEGTGLGLYIAKQIVVGHHGTIDAASDGPGKGSTFTVTIPAAR